MRSDLFLNDATLFKIYTRLSQANLAFSPATLKSLNGNALFMLLTISKEYHVLKELFPIEWYI